MKKDSNLSVLLAGLIKEKMTCNELVEKLMKEAEERFKAFC